MRKLLTNIWAIITPIEKRRLMALALAIVFINLIDITSLAFLVIIVNYYTVSNASLPAFFPSWLEGKDSLNLIGFFLVFFIAKSILGYFISRFQFKFIYSVASRLSAENLLRYLEGSFMDYVNIDSAVQIRQISQQPVEFCHYVLSGVLQMFTELILILLTVTAILIYDARLFVLLLVMLLPAMILISYFGRRRLKHVKANVKSSGEKAIQYLQEALSGYVESNIYNKKSFFTKRYADYQRILNNYLSDLQVIQGLPARSVEVFAVLGLFILLAINQSNVRGLISIVTIGAFMAAAYKIIPGIVKLVNLNNQVKTYFFTTLKLGYHPATSIPEDIHDSIHSIEFRSVGFKFKDHVVLNAVNLHIAEGDMVGISAPSGKGKTTLVNLLLGFLDTTEGEILVNNRGSSALKRQQFWKEISYVKQQPYLIHNTILCNITLHEGQTDNDLLKKATQVSGLEEMITKSDLGLNTIITENGKNISGGQRQRIALARALYKNASLIILDEPFNELDEASETAILQFFQKACANGKTVILITHNKRSLSYCSKLFSLDES